MICLHLLMNHSIYLVISQSLTIIKCKEINFIFII